MSETENGQPNDAFEDASGAPSSAPQTPPAAATEAEVQQLRTDLAAARKRVDDLARAFQTMEKDREDFKKRLTREREQLADTERGKVATALLEAMDELDLCLTAASEDHSPLAKGVRFIRENLLSKVAATGVERLNLVGEKFDPNVAEAADMEITSDPAEDQTIVAEIRAGYRLNGKMIRAARVKVAKYLEPAQA